MCPADEDENDENGNDREVLQKKVKEMRRRWAEWEQVRKRHK